MKGIEMIILIGGSTHTGKTALDAVKLKCSRRF